MSPRHTVCPHDNIHGHRRDAVSALNGSRQYEHSSEDDSEQESDAVRERDNDGEDDDDANMVRVYKDRSTRDGTTNTRCTDHKHTTSSMHCSSV